VPGATGEWPEPRPVATSRAQGFAAGRGAGAAASVARTSAGARRSDAEGAVVGIAR
jgi:hypothetical protein